MAFALIRLSPDIIKKKAVQEILDCNARSSSYGLALTMEQAVELSETRSSALLANGRVEFGGGIIEELIDVFCDSPYINACDYAGILNRLVEIFYYYKNETLDRVPDDDLLQFMKTSFDGVCGGDLTLLATRELDAFARQYGQGKKTPKAESQEEDDE